MNTAARSYSSEYRSRRASTLDPITIDVVRHKLDGIANEMQATVLRSSFSVIVKEGMDASSSLFTLSGETISQGMSIPIHLSTLIPIVEKIIEVFPVETMREGDLYTLNDPYHGGTHLPDIAVVMPCFFDGKPIALAAVLTHHQDVGGMSPGSLPTNATEIFQEGLRIPPLKLRDGGVFNDTLLAMIKLNTRLPDTIMGDLNAQIAACNVGAMRMQDLWRVYGEKTHEIIDELLDRSEFLTRKALSEIPEGSYNHVGYMDNDGVKLDERMRFETTVTIRDGSMHVDFTGTSPQVAGPFNCVPSGALAAACYAIRIFTGPDIPTNGGCFRPISMHIPEGTVMNPLFPAPVNARSSAIMRSATTILGALRDTLPTRLSADPGSQSVIIAFGGQRTDGSRFVMTDLLVAGSGACHDMDGVDVIASDVGNSTNVPVETIEPEFPIRILQYRLREGSGGAGRFRGGLGCIREYEILKGPIRLSHRGERVYCVAEGYDGGGSAPPHETEIVRSDGRREFVPSKLETILGTGDRMIVRTCGGGGWGPPEERDPARIREDLKNQKI